MKETAPKLSATDTFGLGPTLALMFAHYRRSWDESKKWQQISLGFFLVFFLFFYSLNLPKLLPFQRSSSPAPVRAGWMLHASWPRLCSQNLANCLKTTSKKLLRSQLSDKCKNKKQLREEDVQGLQYRKQNDSSGSSVSDTAQLSNSVDYFMSLC